MRGTVMIAGALLGILGWMMTTSIIAAPVGLPTMGFGLLLVLVGLFSSSKKG